MVPVVNRQRSPAPFLTNGTVTVVGLLHPPPPPPLTVTAVLSVKPPSTVVAVMVELPAATPATTPELFTVATDTLLLLQVTAGLLALAGETAAVSGAVLPAASARVAGVTLTPVTAMVPPPPLPLISKWAHDTFAT